MKRCPGYGREPHLVPTTDFANGRSNRDGLQKRCRTCHSAAMKARRVAVKLMTKVSGETKRCARCVRVGRPPDRPTSDFHSACDTIDGKRNHCKDCVRELRWAAMGIVGMTVERFALMLEQQGGKCSIPSCGNVNAPARIGSTNSVRVLDVDHDHATGTVRGLLCKSCNVALGSTRESVAILRDMIAYLSPAKV